MPVDAFRGRSQVGYYGDFVAQVDATVGRLLDVLERKQLADNTLVIFTSDNGAHWLPSDIEWGHRANADWRGQKADIWEGGHRRARSSSAGPAWSSPAARASSWCV